MKGLIWALALGLIFLNYTAYSQNNSEKTEAVEDSLITPADSCIVLPEYNPLDFDSLTIKKIIEDFGEEGWEWTQSLYPSVKHLEIVCDSLPSYLDDEKLVLHFYGLEKRILFDGGGKIGIRLLDKDHPLSDKYRVIIGREERRDGKEVWRHEGFDLNGPCENLGNYFLDEETK